MPNPSFNVAVIGGGIGGLCFALALSRARNDVTIDIYEAGPNFSEFGAGLNLWPRVLEILHNFGLKDALGQYVGSSAEGRKMKFCKSDQREAVFWGETPAVMHGIHRADLLHILVEHTGSSCQSHFSKKLVSYEEIPDGPIRMAFADGSAATCDLLVGADGVKSAVRAAMYTQMADKLEREGRSAHEVQNMKKHVRPTWSGQLIYRQLVPTEVVKKACPGHVSIDSPTFFQGRSKNLITYPISKGRWVNAAGIVARHELYGTQYDRPWSTQVSNAELASEFVGWNESAQQLVKLMDNPARWAVNVVDDLPTFISGRVAVLGDAAHSMTTHQAAGAMQAVEDAFILAALLALPETCYATLSLVLQVYDEIRRPIAQDVQRYSLHTGKQLFLEHLEDVTQEMSLAGQIPMDQILRQGKEAQKLYAWTTTTSAVPDRDRAIEVYRARLYGVEIPTRERRSVLSSEAATARM